MGFESKVSGSISAFVPGMERHEMAVAIQNEIDKLPKVEEDTWPFLPRDIFAITQALTPTVKVVHLNYENVMIHFAMSVKQLESDLDEWLSKFEAFMKRIPGANEALVHVQLTPFTGSYKYSYLSYYWEERFIDGTNEREWYFKGDKRTLDEICDPVNVAASFRPR